MVSTGEYSNIVTFLWISINCQTETLILILHLVVVLKPTDTQLCDHIWPYLHFQWGDGMVVLTKSTQSAKIFRTLHLYGGSIYNGSVQHS